LIVVIGRSAVSWKSPPAPKASRPRPESAHTPSASAALRASSWLERWSVSSTASELVSLRPIASRTALRMCVSQAAGAAGSSSTR
jgi:hypothetical protein